MPPEHARYHEKPLRATSSGGSGGFYKYRCKYFYSHNCTNWVWVKDAPCASCMAQGREADWKHPLHHHQQQQQQRQHQHQFQHQHLPSSSTPSAAHFWPPPPTHLEIFVPRLCNGRLQYKLAELIVPSDGSCASWIIRDKGDSPDTRPQPRVSDMLPTIDNANFGPTDLAIF